MQAVAKEVRQIMHDHREREKQMADEHAQKLEQIRLEALKVWEIQRKKMEEDHQVCYADRAQ